MIQINFSYNWNNKLQCHYYTTLRLNSPKFTVGLKYEIQLKKQKIHVGKIIEIRLLSIDKINEFIGGLDTGYSAEECRLILKRMYKDQDLSKEIIALILIRNEDWNTALREAISDEANKLDKSEIFNIHNP